MEKERERDSFDLRSINLCSTTEADFSFFSFPSFLLATIFFVLCRWLVPSWSSSSYSFVMGLDFETPGDERS